MSLSHLREEIADLRANALGLEARVNGLVSSNVAYAELRIELQEATDALDRAQEWLDNRYQSLS